MTRQDVGQLRRGEAHRAGSAQQERQAGRLLQLLDGEDGGLEVFTGYHRAVVG